MLLTALTDIYLAGRFRFTCYLLSGYSFDLEQCHGCFSSGLPKQCARHFSFCTQRYFVDCYSRAMPLLVFIRGGKWCAFLPPLRLSPGNEPVLGPTARHYYHEAKAFRSLLTKSFYGQGIIPSLSCSVQPTPSRALEPYRRAR
jgi:hypothetical protein